MSILTHVLETSNLAEIHAVANVALMPVLAKLISISMLMLVNVYVILIPLLVLETSTLMLILVVAYAE